MFSKLNLSSEDIQSICDDEFIKSITDKLFNTDFMKCRNDHNNQSVQPEEDVSNCYDGIDIDYSSGINVYPVDNDFANSDSLNGGYCDDNNDCVNVSNDDNGCCGVSDNVGCSGDVDCCVGGGDSGDDGSNGNSGCCEGSSCLDGLQMLNYLSFIPGVGPIFSMLSLLPKIFNILNSHLDLLVKILFYLCIIVLIFVMKYVMFMEDSTRNNVKYESANSFRKVYVWRF